MPILTRSKSKQIRNYYKTITRSQSRDQDYKNTLITEDEAYRILQNYTPEEIVAILKMYEKKDNYCSNDYENTDEDEDKNNSKNKGEISTFGYLVIAAIMSINVWQYLEIVDSPYLEYLEDLRN